MGLSPTLWAPALAAPGPAHVGADLHHLNTRGAQVASPLLPARTPPGTLDLPNALQQARGPSRLTRSTNRPLTSHQWPTPRAPAPGSLCKWSAGRHGAVKPRVVPSGCRPVCVGGRQPQAGGNFREPHGRTDAGSGVAFCVLRGTCSKDKSTSFCGLVSQR